MKKVMKKTIILEVLVIIISSMMMGCGKVEAEKSKENGKGKAIVGEWEQMDGTQTIEFFKEGTVIVVNKGDPPLTGDYRVIDDNRIRMNLALFGPITAQLSPLLDEITLTNPFGVVERYRRIEEIREKAESNKKIAGRYIINKEPGIVVFKEDGTITKYIDGKWEWDTRRGIRLYSGDKELMLGGWSNESIKYGGRVFLKKEGASIIKKGSSVGFIPSSEATLRVRWAQNEAPSSITASPESSELNVYFMVWSDYLASDNVSTLKFRRDGIFSIKEVLHSRWSIEGWTVQIHNKEERLEGKIKGNTLIFGQGENITIFTRQS